jgi:hypothetical protein
VESWLEVEFLAPEVRMVTRQQGRENCWEFLQQPDEADMERFRCEQVHIEFEATISKVSPSAVIVSPFGL